jgi:hypothetical protein
MSNKQHLENTGITAKIKQRMDAIRQKDIKDLTTAEKLMMRGWEQTTTTAFKSSVGEIEIVMRIPFVAELETLQKITGKMMAGQAAENDEMELYTILADVCMDASLDVDFFKSGLFSIADFVVLIKALAIENAAQAADAASFRKK